MKRLLLFVFFAIFLLVVFFVVVKKRPRQTTPVEKDSVGYKPEITTSQENSEDKKVLNNNTKISWIEIRDLNKLKLYSNVNEKYSSVEGLQKYQCNYLTSAGFYTKEGTHIGLFVVDSYKISNHQENSTFNGFFFITNNKASISYSSPQNPEVVVQSGPVLFDNGQSVNLQLKSDENSRRIVVATSKEKVYFIVFYFEDNVFSGPRLEDLPALLKNLKKDKNLDFNSALNLDGGNHSVFITQTERLVESSKAGGFFCIKP